MRRNLLVLILAAALGGCIEFEHFPRMGGERCDPVWDRINYKECYEELRKSGEAPLPAAEEKPPEENFGACSPEDLANHTCH